MLRCMKSPARDRVAIIAAYAAMCLIWGTTWLAIKVGLHAIAPLTSVGLRFLIASALLSGISAWRGERHPWRELPWKVIVVLAIFLFALNYTLIYTSETRLDSGLVAVLFGTLPFFAFAYGRAMVGERTTLRTWLGAVAAFGGVVLVSIGGAVNGSPLYALAAIGAAASGAFGNVYAKRHSYRPLVTLPPAMAIAGAAVLMIGLVFEHTNWSLALGGTSIGALLYLAIFGSGIAFFLFMWLLQRLPASTVGLAPLTFPVIAIAAGAFFGGEHVSTRELVGSALVLIGLWIALSKSERAVAPDAARTLYSLIAVARRLVR